jgi:hypothetical protein
MQVPATSVAEMDWALIAVPNAGCQRGPEPRSQKPEARSQKPEARSQKPVPSAQLQSNKSIRNDQSHQFPFR